MAVCRKVLCCLLIFIIITGSALIKSPSGKSQLVKDICAINRNSLSPHPGGHIVSVVCLYFKVVLRFYNFRKDENDCLKQCLYIVKFDLKYLQLIIASPLRWIGCHMILWYTMTLLECFWIQIWMKFWALSMKFVLDQSSLIIILTYLVMLQVIFLCQNDQWEDFKLM